MKIPVFLIILLVYLLTNTYIFYRIWVAMPHNIYMRIGVIILGTILTFSFFTSAVWGDALPISITSILYKIGSSWIFIGLYFVLIFLLQDIILLSNKIFNYIPENVLTQFSRSNWTTMLFTFCFIALLMLGGYLHYLSKERVHIPIQLTKTINDSTSTKPLKIVAISDLHLGYTIGKSELEKWVKLINDEKPDLILIAGDLIDNSLRPVENENLATTLRELKATKGVYACLGNHEYIGGVAQKKEQLGFFERANIHLLRDEIIEIDSSFYIVGRDDRSNGKRKELPNLLNGVDKTKPIILLDHQPYNLEVAEQNGIDLQISGHTHKGQVWPVSMVTDRLYENDHGLLKKGNTYIYVSSGLGLWGGKFRIGTQSEYVVIEIS